MNARSPLLNRETTEPRIHSMIAFMAELAGMAELRPRGVPEFLPGIARAQHDAVTPEFLDVQRNSTAAPPASNYLPFSEPDEHVIGRAPTRAPFEFTVISTKVFPRENLIRVICRNVRGAAEVGQTAFVSTLRLSGIRTRILAATPETSRAGAALPSRGYEVEFKLPHDPVMVTMLKSPGAMIHSQG